MSEANQGVKRHLGRHELGGIHEDVSCVMHVSAPPGRDRHIAQLSAPLHLPLPVFGNQVFPQDAGIVAAAEQFEEIAEFTRRAQPDILLSSQFAGFAEILLRRSIVSGSLRNFPTLQVKERGAAEIAQKFSAFGRSRRLRFLRVRTSPARLSSCLVLPARRIRNVARLA